MPEASIESVPERFDALFQGGVTGVLTDGQLLERFVSGTGPLASTAFAALVSRHGSMVLRVCRRALDDPHEAEDAAQVVFQILAKRAGSIRRRLSAASWLFGVALRVARRAKSLDERRRRLERRGAEMHARRLADAAEAETPDRVLDRQALHEEIGRLPESLRNPLVVCDLEGLTQDQAAARLGLATRTLQRRLAKARDRLRIRLTRRGLAPAGLLATAAIAAEAYAAILPPSWAAATLLAATNYASGHAAIGAASAAALTLARETSRAMMMTQLKLAASASLLAATTFGVLLAPALDPNPQGPAPNDSTLAARTPRARREQSPAPRRVPEGPTACDVTVLDGESHLPIPGATIRYLIDQTSLETRTDAEGRARLDLAASEFGRVTLSLDAWAYGYVQQRHVFTNADGNAPDVPERFEVGLLPGSETFGGIVRDEEGRPITGAAVELSGHLAEKLDSHELAWKVRSTTDADGRWRNGGLRAMKSVNLYITHPDHLDDDDRHPRDVGNSGDEGPPSFDDLRAGSRVDVMEAGLEVDGFVLDDDGTPIAGASVGLVEDQKILSFQIPEVTTDADGGFRFPHARPGQLSVIARADGHEPGIELVEVAPDLGPIEFRLGPGKVLEGRVLDRDGRPIEDAEIYINRWRGYRGLSVFLATDSGGHFRWDEAPAGAVELTVFQHGYLPVSWDRVFAGDKDLTFLLAPALWIKGRITDAETGGQIDRVEVAARPVGLDFDDEDWQVQERGVSGGDLRIGLDASKAPAWRIKVSAVGYEPVESPDFESDSGTIDYEVKMKPSDKM